MKKIIYLLNALVLITATSAYAMEYNPGPYLGGQVGWGRIDEGSGYKNSTGTTTTELGTFTGWRAYVGYSFIPFFSIESGYSYYPVNTYTGTSNIEVRTYTIDLVGKLIIPLKIIVKPLARFSIYGKGGGAYVRTKITNSTVNTKTNNTIRPAYGAGFIFSFTDNIAVDASWTGVYGKNRVNSASDVTGGDPTPTCNLFTLGLSYKITGIF